MKKIIFTIALFLGIIEVNYAEIIIQVKRTEINIGPNGCKVVSGFDKVTYNGDGTIQRIDRSIGCADPGSEECPPDNLHLAPVLDQNGIEALPIAVVNNINQLIAAAYANSGSNTSGSSSSQVWIYGTNGNIVGQYAITLTWNKVLTGSGYELTYNILVNQI